MKTAKTAALEFLVRTLLSAWQACGLTDEDIDALLAQLEGWAPLVPKVEGDHPAYVYYGVTNPSLHLEQRLESLLRDRVDDPCGPSYWQRWRAARLLFEQMARADDCDPKYAEEDNPDWKEFWEAFEIEAAKLP